MASSELVDMVEDLIPRVLGHEANECVQTDDCLLIKMAENRCREGIGMMILPLFKMNVRS